MIDYATFQRIQHLHRVEQLTVAQIAHAIALDARTVRRWLDEPRFRPRLPCARPSKLDPYKAYIRRLLEHHPYSAAQILNRLREAGYLAQTARTCIYGHLEECNANDPAVSHLNMDGLELGKDAEHVEERLACSGRGVHGLFGGSQMGALVLECRDNDLEITHRARRRSIRVTTSVSPGWMESRMVRSSGRPARVAPSTVSVRTMVQPAA